jgi:integrase
MGRDVIADYDAFRRRQKSEHDSRAKNTFASAARDFVEQYASKKTRRWRETARLLGLAYPSTGGEPIRIKGGLCERWKDRSIADIDAHDIHSLIDETRRSGAPGLERRNHGPTEARARVMLSCLSKMFSWLGQHRGVSQNPCKDVHRPEASRALNRVLTQAEIVKFWRATDAERTELSALLKLLLLTGCRLNEVAG